VEIDPAFAQGLDGIAAGSEVILLTWLHQSDRDTLRVHPRDDPQSPLKGVFATRSPDRPNPIGLHRVRVLEITESVRLRVEPLEALDGTPVVDIKPVLAGAVEA
jgi:tRNA-Thr(GGU) m(6)t(6)A37 methyltransferase TsaA